MTAGAAGAARAARAGTQYCTARLTARRLTARPSDRPTARPPIQCLDRLLSVSAPALHIGLYVRPARSLWESTERQAADMSTITPCYSLEGYQG